MIQRFTYVKHPNNGIMVYLSDSTKRMHFKGITEDQMQEGMIRYNQGYLIQKAFDFLDVDQREFLMTGMTPQDWEYTFGKSL